MYDETRYILIKGDFSENPSFEDPKGPSILNFVDQKRLAAVERAKRASFLKVQTPPLFHFMTPKKKLLT